MVFKELFFYIEKGKCSEIKAFTSCWIKKLNWEVQQLVINDRTPSNLILFVIFALYQSVSEWAICLGL